MAITFLLYKSHKFCVHQYHFFFFMKTKQKAVANMLFIWLHF